MITSYEIRWGHPRTHKSNGSARRMQRRIDAEARQAEYDALTTQEKVARALSRPGLCKRELAKLSELLH